MNIFTPRKLVAIALFLVALVGVVEFVRTSTPVPDAPAQPAQQSQEASTTTPALSTAAQPSPEPHNVTPVVLAPSIPDQPKAGVVLHILKDVGEAAFDHFGLTQKDFLAIKQAGFDVIEGNFDLCADDADVRFFLDSAASVGLKVILNAGAGEAEWGYACDDNFVAGQKPVWQEEKVKEWVVKWKGHSALYAWDTSNEDGGTLPFGTGGTKPDPDWETKYSLSTEQLQQAYSDVKSLDPSHEVMIRMNGWYFYDNDGNFFRSGNAFGRNVADIVMINAYSNVEEYFPDFVSTVLIRATRSMYAIDPRIKVIPALGVWSEPPIWVKPTSAHLINDFNQARKAENLLGIAFFKYGASAGRDWLLPDTTRGDPKLWQTISELIKKP